MDRVFVYRGLPLKKLLATKPHGFAGWFESIRYPEKEYPGESETSAIVMTEVHAVDKVP